MYSSSGDGWGHTPSRTLPLERSRRDLQTQPILADGTARREAVQPIATSDGTLREGPRARRHGLHRRLSLEAGRRAAGRDQH